MSRWRGFWWEHSETIVLFTLLALVLLCIVGFTVSAEAIARACDRAGGKLVASGPAYYARSGNVLVPIQNYKCVVEP